MRTKRVLKYLLIAVGVVMLGLILAFVIMTSPGKAALMPNPNGFDDLVKAGEMVHKGKSYGSVSNRDELRQYVAANQEALKLGRIGLGRECRVPDDYSPDYINRFITWGVNVKALAVAFYAEAKLAQMEGRTNNAIDGALADMELGIRGFAGGYEMAKLIGIACETMGRNSIAPLTNSLASKDCSKICQELERLDGMEEPLSETWSHENQWILKGLTLKEKAENWREFLNLPSERRYFTSRCRTNTLARRELILTLAARAYRLEKGKPPTNTAALVPDYIKKIPQDPVTGKDLVLQASAGNH